MCFYSAMKHENDVSDMISSLQFIRVYSFMKEIKLYIPHISSFYLLRRKIVILLKKLYKLSTFRKHLNKTNVFSVPSWPGENLGKLHLGFSLICSRILPSVRLSFHRAMKARRKALFLKCHFQSWVKLRNKG